MARGWQELRLELDGRWQPTGQLRDRFPFDEPVPVREEVLRDVVHRPVHSMAGTDTSNEARTVFVAGEAPAHGTLHGTIGWARFRNDG